MSEKPREYTEAEIREKFIRHIWDLIDYWEHVQTNDGYVKTTRDRMSGLAFSILTALDGEAGDLPGFHVVPCAAEEDKDYLISQGENWYPRLSQRVKDTLCDIGGSLHEVFHSLDPRRPKSER